MSMNNDADWIVEEMKKEGLLGGEDSQEAEKEEKAPLKTFEEAIQEYDEAQEEQTVEEEVKVEEFKDFKPETAPGAAPKLQVLGITENETAPDMKEARLASISMTTQCPASKEVAASPPPILPFPDDAEEVGEPVTMQEVSQIEGAQMFAKVKPERGRYIAVVGFRKDCGSRADAQAFCNEFRDRDGRPLVIDYSLD